MSDGSPQAADAASRATIGPYEIIKVLERGPRETVYLGVEPTSEREVAIRVSADVDPLPLRDQAARDAFAGRELVHRHLLRFFEAGEHNGLSYIVEEVRRGQSLADLLRVGAETLDLAARLDLVAQLCTALHFVHEHALVHGDVRPANVFITNDGVVKLLNLGAGLPSEITIVSDNALSGSYEYNSPEQLMGRGDIDGRSDIFSAGVILYELVSGHRPFQGPSTAITLARIVRDDPPPLEGMPEIDAVVRRALEKDSAKRFASAQELAYALWTVGMSSSEQKERAETPETVYVAPPEEPQVTVVAQTPDMPLISMETMIYAGITAAVIVGAGALLRMC